MAVRNGFDLVFSDQIVRCLKNYIKKGGEAFLKMQDYFGRSYVDLIHLAIDQVLEVHSTEFEDMDIVNMN